MGRIFGRLWRSALPIGMSGDEDLYLALVQDRLTGEQRARLILENHALHAGAVRFTWRGQPREFTCAPEPWFTGLVGPT